MSSGESALGSDVEEEDMLSSQTEDKRRIQRQASSEIPVRGEDSSGRSRESEEDPEEDEPQVGSKVLVASKDSRQQATGVVTRVNRDGTFDIEYREGDMELSVQRSRLEVVTESDEEAETEEDVFFRTVGEVDMVEAEMKAADRRDTGQVPLSTFVNVMKDQLEPAGAELQKLLNYVQTEFSGRKRNTVIYLEFLREQRKKILHKTLKPLLTKDTLDKLVEAFQDDVEVSEAETAQVTDKSFSRYLKSKGSFTQEEIRVLTCSFDITGEGCVDKGAFLRFATLVDLSPTAAQLKVLDKVRTVKEPTNQIFHKFAHRMQSKASRTNIHDKLLSSFLAKDDDETGVVSADCFVSVLRTLRVVSNTSDSSCLADLFAATPAKRKNRSKVDYRKFLRAIQSKKASLEHIKKVLTAGILACARQGTDLVGRFKSSQEHHTLDSLTTILAEDFGLPLLPEDIFVWFDHTCMQRGQAGCEEVESDWVYKALKKLEMSKDMEKVSSSALKGVNLDRFIELIEEEYDTHEKNYVTRKQFAEALEKVKEKQPKLSVIRPLLELLDPQRLNKVIYGELRSFASGTETRTKRATKEAEETENSQEDESGTGESSASEPEFTDEPFIWGSDAQKTLCNAFATHSSTKRTSPLSALRSLSSYDAKTDCVASTQLRTFLTGELKVPQQLAQLCVDTFEHPYKEDRVEIEPLVEFSTSQRAVEAFAVSAALSKVKKQSLEDCNAIFHHHLPLKERLARIRRDSKGNSKTQKLVREAGKENDNVAITILKLAKAANIAAPQSLMSLIQQRFDRSHTGVITTRNLTKALSQRFRTMEKADLIALTSLSQPQTLEAGQRTWNKNESFCYVPLVSYIDNCVLQKVDTSFVVQRVRNLCEIGGINIQDVQLALEKGEAGRRKRKHTVGELSSGNFVNILVQSLPLCARDLSVLLATFEKSGRVKYKEFCSALEREAGAEDDVSNDGSEDSLSSTEVSSAVDEGGGPESEKERRGSMGSWYTSLRRGRQHKAEREEHVPTPLATSKVKFATAVRERAGQHRMSPSRLLEQLLYTKTSKERGLISAKNLKRTLRKEFDEDELGVYDVELICGLLNHCPRAALIELVQIELDPDKYLLFHRLFQDEGLREYFEPLKDASRPVYKSHREACEILKEEGRRRYKKSEIESVVHCFEHTSERGGKVDLSRLAKYVFYDDTTSRLSYKQALQLSAKLLDDYSDTTMEAAIKDWSSSKPSLADREVITLLCSLGCFVSFQQYHSFVAGLLGMGKHSKKAGCSLLLLKDRLLCCLNEDDKLSGDDTDNSVSGTSFESDSDKYSESTSSYSRSGAEEESSASERSISPRKQRRQEKLYSNSQLRKELGRAFRIIDSDGNGYVDERELSQAMVALGSEAALGDIREILEDYEVESQGQLSQKEFVEVLQSLIWKRRKEILPERRQEVLNYLNKLRQALGNKLTKEELLEALSDPEMLGMSIHANKEQVQVLIEALADDNSYSLARLASFTRNFSLKRKHEKQRKGKGVPEDLRAALISLFFGQVNDPTEYLKLFKGLPGSFRLSTLKQEEAASAKRLTKLLELSTVAVRPKHSGESLSFELALKHGKGIPAVGGNLSSVKVLKRQARVSLLKKNSRGRDTDSLVGNQYVCLASQDQSQQDSWRFKGGKLVIHIDAGDLSSDLCVFVELTVLLDLKGISRDKDILEFSCGWALVQVAKLNPSHQEITVVLQGGSPTCPEEIRSEDVRFRRTGWRSLVRRSSLATPCLTLRCHSLKSSTDKAGILTRLGSSVVLSHEALQLVALHRSLLRLERTTRKAALQEAAPCFVPELNVLPQVLSSAELTRQVLRLYQQASGRFKGRGHSHKQMGAFREAVLQLWPANVQIQLHNAKPSAFDNSKLQEIDFIRSKPDEVLFEPFHIQQLIV